MESELYCEDYYVSDPGDEQSSIGSDYLDETDEE